MPPNMTSMWNAFMMASKLKVVCTCAGTEAKGRVQVAAKAGVGEGCGLADSMHANDMGR